MKPTILIALLLSFNFAFSQVDTTLYGYVDSTTFRPVEVLPAFPGGPSTWVYYLKKSMQNFYGSGTVIVEFTIERDGSSPKNIKIYQSDDRTLNSRAIKIIKNSI